jgi:glutamate formiminotransferase
MKTLVECVANFSERRDLKVLDAIVSVPASAEELDPSVPPHVGQE